MDKMTIINEANLSEAALVVTVIEICSATRPFSPAGNVPSVRAQLRASESHRSAQPSARGSQFSADRLPMQASI